MLELLSFFLCLLRCTDTVRGDYLRASWSEAGFLFPFFFLYSFVFVSNSLYLAQVFFLTRLLLFVIPCCC